MVEELKIEETVNGDIILFTLEGKLDAKTAPQLSSVLSNAILKSHKIICNLEKLTYIASAGIGIFLKFLQETKSKNGNLYLVGLQKQVKDVFDLLKFSSLFQMFSSNEEAIKNF